MDLSSKCDKVTAGESHSLLKTTRHFYTSWRRPPCSTLSLEAVNVVLTDAALSVTLTEDVFLCRGGVEWTSFTFISRLAEKPMGVTAHVCENLCLSASETVLHLTLVVFFFAQCVGLCVHLEVCVREHFRDLRGGTVAL